MSWSLPTITIDTSVEDWTLSEPFSSWTTIGGDPTTEEEVATAVEWVKDSIVDAVATQVVGSSGKKFFVTANGHSNPNNEPRAGWGNDIVTITIGQENNDK